MSSSRCNNGRDVALRPWILLGLICLVAIAAAQSSANFDLSWNVIGGGGGKATSSSYQLQGTVGQVAGTAASSSYTLSAGYWYPEPLRGDLNNNGIIDWGDVVKCAYMAWGRIAADVAEADFNGNGIVDWGDVVKLAYCYWGKIPAL